jgi:hypothetical protein
MNIYSALRRQLVVTILAVSAVITVMSTATEWGGRSSDELINRPAGPFLCDHRGAGCERGM